MSGLLGFGASGANAGAPTKLAGYRVQTSILGSAIPIVGGTNRIAGNVIWLGNWQSHTVTSGGKGSSKGSGGGKGGGQFTYSASYIIALSQGPCVQILSIWQDKAQITDPNQQPNVFAVGGRGQGLWGYLAGTFPNQALGYSEIAYAGFENQSLGTGGSISNYSFELAGNALFGGQVTSVSSNKLFITANPLLNGMQVLLILGPGGVAPSGLSAVTASGAIQYYFVVNADSAGVQLSLTSGGSPISFSGGTLPIFCGWEDSLASDWIYFCLNNFNLCNFPAASIGDMTEIRTYCIANGIAISPVLDTQQTMQSYLQEYLLIANSEAFSSEGLIKFRTYGDKAVTANGTTFTPNLTPVYSLDYDAFIVDGNSQNPVTFTLEAAQDANNKLSFEWTNRGRQYNYETVTDNDQNAVNLYGLNVGSVQTIHSCCLATVAQQVLNVQLKRSVYMLRKAQFTLGWKFSILEPMDIVLVPEQYPSLDTVGVRILTMEEDERGNFAVTGEVLPFPILNPVLHPKQVSGGYTPGYEANPGITIAPIFLELPPEMTNSKITTGLILSISLAGGLTWGGTGVYVSKTGSDGPYEFLGQQTAASVMGFLIADYPYNGTDPDTTELLQVNLQPSLGEIDPGNSSLDSANNFKTLILIDQEIVAFAYVTLTGANSYSFENGSSVIYNRRGVFQSNETHHYTGATCSIIGDGNQFQVEYSPPLADGTGGDIGNTWWFKFPAFNQAGAQIQDLADATAYPWTLTAPYVRYPLHWKPYAEVSTIFAPSGFGMSMAQVSDSTGDNLIIKGMPPVDVFSPVVTAPIIDAVATVTPNGAGNLLVGDFVMQIFAIDTDGLYSPGSNLMSISVPVVQSQIDFNIILPTGTVKYQIFVGSDMDDLATLEDPITGTPTTITITSTGGSPPNFPSPGIGFGPPDQRFNRFHIQAKSEIHGGITTVQAFGSSGETTWSSAITYAYGDRVIRSGDHFISLVNGNLNHTPNPVGLTAFWSPINLVVLIVPPAGLTDHYLDGRILSLVSRIGLPDTLPWEDVQIDYNTSTGIIVLLQPTDFELGDLLLIRTKATAVGANYIEDSEIDNPWFPGGNTDSDTNFIVRVLHDPTGAATGLTSPVISNTTIRYNVHEWDTTPGIGSIFIVEEQGWDVDVVTTAIPNAIAPSAGAGPQPVQIGSIPWANLIRTVALVQVTLQDINGVDALSTIDGIRELYIVPSPNGGTPFNPGYLTVVQDLSGVVQLNLDLALKFSILLPTTQTTGGTSIADTFFDVTTTEVDNTACPFTYYWDDGSGESGTCSAISGSTWTVSALTGAHASGAFIAISIKIGNPTSVAGITSGGWNSKFWLYYVQPAPGSCPQPALGSSFVPNSESGITVDGTPNTRTSIEFSFHPDGFWGLDWSTTAGPLP